ncbi:MAG: serine/threonine protein kinase [Myxococcales bacterium]|nr:serine/threonine protein kinase [Myxococcales bacterium]
MASELKGTEISGWLIEDVAGHGKSAIVFRATKGGSTAAVKVFDPDLVARFGRAAQQERVYRERKLVGKYHPNLVSILDAGWDDEKSVFFVVMEFVEGQTIADVVATLPRDKIHPLIAQIAAAAEFLESMTLAHRDIKPENIGISPDLSTAKLLDLGVVRPIGLGNITDQGDRRLFVGTLRYSPPELLVREEQDTLEGWRAVTFYQLGGVLHDMIMRQPLFAKYADPYAELVEAVRRETPVIEATDVPADLRLLAANCLVKDPSMRLGLVSWERLKAPPADRGDARAAAARIAQRRRAASLASATVRHDSDSIRHLQDELRREVRRIVTGILDVEDTFPPRQIDESSSSASVEIEFAASASFSLPNLLHVTISIEVLDPTSMVVKIVADSFAAKESGFVADGPRATNTILEGAYAAAVLAERLKDYLLLALDCGQQQPALPDNGSAHWIHVSWGE